MAKNNPYQKLKNLALLKGILLLFLVVFRFISIAQNKNDAITGFDQSPELNWTFKTDAPLFSSPVVDGNLVYIGGSDSLLHVVDIETGIEKWHFRTHGEIRSNVCIDIDKLYLNGGDGTIYALNKNTGEIQWRFITGGEKKYDFADYFQSTPVVAGGFLYVGSGDGNMYAIEAATGRLVWKFTTGDIVHTTPAIDHDQIYFGSFDGYIYALKINTGKLVWKFKTVGHRFFPKGEVQGSPTVFNGLVFIGARDYNVYALDRNQGYCHWNKAFTKGWGLNNSIHDSVLYIGSADERVLVSANPETGMENWKIDMEFLIFGNNAYSDSMLYVGTTIGKLHGICLDSGKKIWSFETDSYKKNRFKYFKADDSYRDDIYTIIKSNEHFLEVECELGGVFSTPYLSDDYLIFSGSDGVLYCLTPDLTLPK
jgi:outer membrane protein assembly factor BamB